MSFPRKKKTIGRRDKVDFPDLALGNVEVKIDTGAYTSALHVSRIKKRSIKGKLHVEFSFLHHTHPVKEEQNFLLPVEKEKRVKNSSGRSEKRYLIKTRVTLFGKSYITEFSLADRSGMETPVLLGRKLLSRRFIVDVAQKYLSYEEKSKAKKK